jgi:hypothetical protein
MLKLDFKLDYVSWPQMYFMHKERVFHLRHAHCIESRCPWEGHVQLHSQARSDKPRIWVAKCERWAGGRASSPVATPAVPVDIYSLALPEECGVAHDPEAFAHQSLSAQMLREGRSHIKSCFRWDAEFEWMESEGGNLSSYTVSGPLEHES